MELTLTPVLTIILGVMLLLTGMLFKIMHWPDMFKGLYSGWVIILIGCIWLLLKKNKLKKRKQINNQ
jgi:hypothetical protein